VAWSGPRVIFEPLRQVHDRMRALLERRRCAGIEVQTGNLPEDGSLGPRRVLMKNQHREEVSRQFFLGQPAERTASTRRWRRWSDGWKNSSTN